MENPADPNPEKSVMIALLPTTTDWSKIRLPHLTLVYAGILDDLKISDKNDLIKEAQSISLKYKTLTLKVTGVQVFGASNDEKVDVLRLRSVPSLASMRKQVESWNASDFPFNPHATIGPEGSAPSMLPSFLIFDRVSVNWGDEEKVFPLTGNI